MVFMSHRQTKYALVERGSFNGGAHQLRALSASGVRGGGNRQYYIAVAIDVIWLTYCLDTIPLDIVKTSITYTLERVLSYHGMIVYTKTENKGARVVSFNTSSGRPGVPVHRHELAQKTTHWISIMCTLQLPLVSLNNQRRF